ncbi:MAG: hypothetical protein V2I47_06515 [Bacteroidales bacterium]|jgi:hypothetical protein|nr:hypothetical protein [Bacteroidales bacterium]
MLDVEKIVDVDNEIVGRLMESILNEREIPHILRTNHDSAYDGLFAYQKGWGFIEADPRYREEILEIYEDVKKQQG